MGNFTPYGRGRGSGRHQRPSETKIEVEIATKIALKLACVNGPDEDVNYSALLPFASKSKLLQNERKKTAYSGLACPPSPTPSTGKLFQSTRSVATSFS